MVYCNPFICLVLHQEIYSFHNISLVDKFFPLKFCFFFSQIEKDISLGNILNGLDKSLLTNTHRDLDM